MDGALEDCPPPGEQDFVVLAAKRSGLGLGLGLGPGLDAVASTPVTHL